MGVEVLRFLLTGRIDCCRRRVCEVFHFFFAYYRSVYRIGRRLEVPVGAEK
jgi:hypothetical protein